MWKKMWKIQCFSSISSRHLLLFLFQNPKIGTVHMFMRRWSWILQRWTKDIIMGVAIVLSVVIVTEEIDTVETGHTLRQIPTCTTKVIKLSHKLRPIKRACIELYEVVHTVLSPMSLALLFYRSWYHSRSLSVWKLYFNSHSFRVVHLSTYGENLGNQCRLMSGSVSKM